MINGSLVRPIILGYYCPIALPYLAMLSPERTPRQRILDLLTSRLLSSRELAELIGISERQVEDHLAHLVKSVRRDRTKRFLLEPSECRACGFVFRDRKRLTRPSRCPRCRNEAITPPRYGVEVSVPQQL